MTVPQDEVDVRRSWFARGVSLLILAAMLPTVACSGEPPKPPPDPPDAPATLAVDHDASTLADRWRRARAELPGVTPPEITVTDAALALASVIEGRVDAALVLRRATAAEDRFAEGSDLIALASLHYERVARVPVTLLVHESNAVDIVDLEEMRRILAGEVREWDSVGGRSEEISLYGRDAGTSTSRLVSDLLQGRAMAHQLKVLPSDEAVAEAVRADALGLGIAGGMPARGTRALALRDGDQVLMPGVASTSTRSWPMVRDVYMVTQGPPIRRLRELLEFTRSDPGRAIAEQSGFHPWMEPR